MDTNLMSFPTQRIFWASGASQAQTEQKHCSANSTCCHPRSSRLKEALNKQDFEELVMGMQRFRTREISTEELVMHAADCLKTLKVRSGGYGFGPEERVFRCVYDWC